jgi:hypothetical protein
MRGDSPVWVCRVGIVVLVFPFALVLPKHLLELTERLGNLAVDLAANRVPLFQLFENLTKPVLRLGLCGV